MYPALDPSWRHYPRTIVQIAVGDTRLRIDLRDPIPPPLALQLSRIGPDAGFAVLTSDNPRGRSRSVARNERDHRQLASELADRHVFHLAADGLSPEGSHMERGFTIWIAREAARELARAYGQSAFFWFDGARFLIEGALVDAPRQRLPITP